MNATTACKCKNFADSATGERLTCTATTARNFAPGHDARLKGFLIRTGRAGHQVITPEGTEVAAIVAAGRFGFAHMVLAGIARVAKTRKPAAPTKPALVAITAKVGRWEYQGTTDGETFSYTDKKGATKETTKYTRV